MLPLQNLLAFALVSALLIAVPGPSVLFVIGRSLALGRRGGLLSVLGNAAGELLQIAAVAFGLGVVLAESVLLFTVVKFAGAAYLIYLGIQAVLHRRGGPASPGPSRPATTRRILREGFIVGATNPKSVVFFVAVLPSSSTILPAPFPPSSPCLVPRSWPSRWFRTASGRWPPARHGSGSPAHPAG